MSKLVRRHNFNIKIYKCKNRHFHWTSKLIEFHQKADYSHIAIGFVSETSREMIIDSTRKNISIYPADKYFQDRYENRGEIEVTLDCSRSGFLDFIEPLMGLDYPEKQIFAILFDIASFSNGSKKMTCNELALRIIIGLKNGFKVEGNLDTIDLNASWAAMEKVSNG